MNRQLYESIDYYDVANYAELDDYTATDRTEFLQSVSLPSALLSNSV